MKIVVACVVLWVAFLPRAAAAQGVDCAKATSPVQKAICADPDLMALDKSMVAAYSAAITQATPAQKTDIEAQQRRWATARDACAKNTDLKGCVTTYYKNRNALLTSFAKGEFASTGTPHTFSCPDKSTVVVEFITGNHRRS